MSINAIITRGFSNGSFLGSISELVTMGYTIGEESSIWTDKLEISTLWEDKSITSVSWITSTSASTIWTDK